MVGPINVMAASATDARETDKARMTSMRGLRTALSLTDAPAIPRMADSFDMLHSRHYKKPATGQSGSTVELSPHDLLIARPRVDQDKVVLGGDPVFRRRTPVRRHQRFPSCLFPSSRGPPGGHRTLDAGRTPLVAQVSLGT